MLKRRLNDEGADEPSSSCLRLKLPALDGKMRAADAKAETMLRIIRRVLSSKAELPKQPERP